MFDVIFFFFVFMPFMSTVRAQRSTPLLVKLIFTSGFTALIGGYYLSQTFMTGKPTQSTLYGSNALFSACLERPANLYDLLELPVRGFSERELKSAFRKASVKYHPDKNLESDTTEKFLEVTKAHYII